MSTSNPWVNPLQRSFQQIKAKLLNELKSLKDADGNYLITDYSEGNILVLILSMFSGIAEVLHYYIDNMARESFFATARRYDSLVKHGVMVDYRAKGAVAPSVDVILSRTISSTSPGAQIVISKGTVFTDNYGYDWLSTKPITWNANTSECKVPLVQHELYNDASVTGTTITTSNQSRIKVPALTNGKLYEDGTMELVISASVWTLVESFAHSNKNSKHFVIEVDVNKNVYIVFGDGTHGAKPGIGYIITKCQYYITNGSKANIQSAAITTTPSSIGSGITCSNPYPAGGGSNYEDFNMLKEHIPLHVRTLGVAITKQDFIDIAMQVSGVNKCAAEYICGRKLNLYITADSGTTASSTLIDNVYQALIAKAPMTTWLSVKSAGTTYIQLYITVTGNKSYTRQTISDQINQALLDKYSIAKSEIGGQVRISDIYALLDNLASVDYLNIDMFYLKPWPTTLAGSSELIIDTYTLTKMEYSGSMTYYISFTSPTAYTIRSKVNGYSTSGTVGTTTPINDTINGITCNVKFTANNYKAGYKYSIVISEPNKDYAEPGFNLPVFTSSSQAQLTINEVL